MIAMVLAARSLLHGFDGIRDDTPDLNGLTILGKDVRVSRVGCLQLQVGTPFPQLLDCELAIHDCDHHVTVASLHGSVDQHHVPIVNAGLAHRGTAYAHQEGGERVLYQDFVEVNALAGMVFGWGRKTGLDATENGLDPGRFCN